MGIIKKIDSSITAAVRNDKILTRPGVSPGAWAMALLPTAVILTFTVHSVSKMYQLCALYSVNIMLNNILLLYQIKHYGTISVLKGLNVYCFLPLLVSSALFSYSGLDLFRSFCHSLANALIYFEALPLVLKLFPRSFSFGEACVVSQAASLFIYGTFIRISRTEQKASGDLEIATTVIQITLAVVLIICFIPKYWAPSRQYAAAALLLLLIVPILSLLLGFNVIYWILEFLFQGHRLRLVCGWAVLSGFAWGMVVAQIRSHNKAGTDIRKVFHFLAVAVFISGIVIDPLLLYFASGLVFPLFILIEFVRLRKLPPLAEPLQAGFHVYADEKDAGGVALTPIYLLLGCSAPLWLLPDVQGFAFTLPLLAGVLSIGVGDSCASIIGKHFGRQKWSGSQKTIEGSIACAVGQATTLLVLTSLGHIPISSVSFFHLAKSIGAVCIGSLIEAKTDQIDNLVLPLITYILLLHR